MPDVPAAVADQLANVGVVQPSGDAELARHGQRITISRGCGLHVPHSPVCRRPTPDREKIWSPSLESCGIEARELRQPDPGHEGLRDG